jgi:hypothetical protein
MKKVLVLGDSHVEVFNAPPMKEAFPEFEFEIVSVGGATVSGLENPNSVTKAMPRYVEALEATSAETVVVMLGEVDTGFVIWYRAQKHGIPVDDMLNLALENYQSFLSKISEKFNAICISTPLPTIQDDMQWGEVANLRKEVKATQAERTALTISFNKFMNAFCAEAGITYIALDARSTTPDGKLRESLLNPNKLDHHYNPAEHVKLIAAPLLAALHAQYGSSKQEGKTKRLAKFISRIVGRSPLK